jgi:hypothetical protein
MKTPQVHNIEEAADYLKSNGLSQVVEASRGGELDVNEKLETRVPFKPDLIDLCRLHRFVIENKRTTILEFGTGWSTWVFADALSKLKLKYADDVRELRRNNPFELHVVDDEAEFIHIAESRIPEQIKDIVMFYEKAAIMGTFDDRICTFYESLPNVSPDFIYVDGPNQFNVKGDISGWSTRHKDMMPMTGDLLRIEHFLTPGTIVVFDGRAANARFFGSNIQRGWDYQYDADYDQHVFVLSEESLGRFNSKQLAFYGN